jgi:hypothetical protein
MWSRIRIGFRFCCVPGEHAALIRTASRESAAVTTRACGAMVDSTGRFAAAHPP